MFVFDSDRFVSDLNAAGEVEPFPAIARGIGVSERVVHLWRNGALPTCRSLMKACNYIGSDPSSYFMEVSDG